MWELFNEAGVYSETPERRFTGLFFSLQCGVNSVKKLPARSKLSLALLGLALLLIACKPGKPAPTVVLTLFPILPTPTLPAPTPTLPQMSLPFGGGQGGGTSSPTLDMRAGQAGGTPSPTLDMRAGQGGGTPTITRTRNPTRTPTSTWTRRPTATNTPLFSIPGELIPATPALTDYDYLLPPWTESLCTTLVDRISKHKFTADPWVEDNTPYALALQAECLLRYPQSKNRERMLWNMAAIDPAGLPLPGMRPGESLFAYLLEDLYQRGAIQSSEELTRTLEAQGYSFTIQAALQVQGLFGDGQEAFVFSLRSRALFDEYCATLTTHQVDGRVRVEILQEWEQCNIIMGSSHYSLSEVSDTNGNALPEVMVTLRKDFSGIPGVSSESLFLIEWDPSVEAFKSSEFPEYHKSCDEGPCEGKYEIGALDADGYRPITVSEYWYTDGPSIHPDLWQGPPQCPALEVRRTYLWNGKRYLPGEDEIVPSQPDRPECSFAWADQVIYQYGWRNDQAIQALSEAVQDWPENMNIIWGPASRDYFRLRLGLWQDLRGEASAALARLQSLASAPTDPQFDYPSRLAAVYLDARAQAGIALACLRVEQAWWDESRAVYEAGSPSQSLTDQLIEGWGFAHPRWDTFPYPAIGSLCDAEAALETAASTLQVSTAAGLEDWFGQLGITQTLVMPVDLDGNGQDDWLAWFQSEDWGDDLFAFVRTPSGLKASEVGGEWVDEKDITLRAYHPDQAALLVQVVQTGKDLYIFYFDEHGELVWLDGEYPVSAFWIDERTEGSQLVVYTQSEYYSAELITYTWNADTRSLERRLVAFDYAPAEAEAERLLFQAQDYAGAIVFIEQFLQDAPPELLYAYYCDQGSCDYQPEWYFPYLRYLLGLAYELDGQPEPAAATYFQLWQDYPSYIFGMVARLKLEPSAP
jgi:hypothetical protein